MAVKFAPGGYLDINTDPSDLPSEIEGKRESSGAMRRCTNLVLDSKGVAMTRSGATVLNSTAVNTSINTIIEHKGNRYIFAGGYIYKNETAIISGLTNIKWTAIAYNPYNSIDEVLYAINGTDRKRINDTTLYEWGIDAPTIPPELNGNIRYAYTQSWEGTTQLSSEELTAQIVREIDDYVRTQFISSDYTYASGSMYTRTIYQWELDHLFENYNFGADIDVVRHTWTFERQTDYNDKPVIGVKYTYVRKNGTVIECESNPSPAAYIEANTGIHVKWTAPADTQVTHVRCYRTVNGGGTFYYAGEFDLATYTYGVLQEADTLLGTEVITTNDRPPLGTIVVGPDFNGYCFIAKDNLLYFCKAKQPEYWPALYYIEVSPIQYPITALSLVGGQLYALTEIEIYQIQGTGYNSFFPVPMKATTGAKSHIGVYGVKGSGIFHVSIDGIYLYTATGDQKITRQRFNVIFKNITSGNIPYVNRTYINRCMIVQFKNKLYFFYPGGSNIWCSDLLVMDINTEYGVVHYQYGTTQFMAACVDVTNSRLLACDTNGYIWQIENSNYSQDNGEDIEWQIESKSFADQLYKYFPRYAKYDVELIGDGEATGYILLNDISKQSHTIASRNTKARLIKTCTGDRLGIRIVGTGSVRIYTTEVE